ncbi:MAG TPA: hypothetical protein VF940_26525 [Streptosporangiaceae bacterium]
MAGVLGPHVAVLHAASRLVPGLVAAAAGELAARAAALQAQLAARESADGVLPEAVAVAGEAFRRVTGAGLTDAQALAGLVASEGGVAELADGEGKSAAAGLAAFLGVLAGGGVHVAVLDDYLARRDHGRLEPVFTLLGLSTGLTLSSLSAARRRAAYGADVTYGSDRQFARDYLRDGLAGLPSDRVQRGLRFAVVDEADTALIDQGRALVSTGDSQPADAARYAAMTRLAVRLECGIHYEIGEQAPVIRLTAAGARALAEWAGLDDPADPERFALDRWLADAIAAREWFARDADYAVRRGRLIPGDQLQGLGRFDRGIRQALEAKEDLPLTAQTKIDGTIMVRDFYRLYDRLGGLTATARPAAAEFRHFYQLTVTPVPGGAPTCRVDLGEIQYRTVPDKVAGLVADVADRHFRGQPVVIGTASERTCAMVSQALTDRGLGHSVLRERQEATARVMADAGRLSALTVMCGTAGRGYALPLGGDPGTRAGVPRMPGSRADAAAANRERVLAAGGLAVLGAERNLLARADDWLAGLAGQRGEPGQVRFYQSQQDPLLSSLTDGGVVGAVPRRYPVGASPATWPGRKLLKMVRDRQFASEEHRRKTRTRLFAYEQVYETQRQQVYQTRQAIADGTNPRELPLIATAEPAGPGHLPAAEATSPDRNAVLSVVDRHWSSHLDNLRRLEEATDWADADPSHGEHYAAEANKSFDAMLARIKREIADLP